jgi:hypothetical protein
MVMMDIHQAEWVMVHIRGNPRYLDSDMEGLGEDIGK